VPVFGDGSTSRDYTFVEDIVSGILASLDRCDRYRIYNLGGSDPVTLSHLIQSLESVIGKTAIIDRRPAQLGDVERTFADLTRSKAELDYAPRVSLREGLQRFVQWYRDFGHLYRLPGEEPQNTNVA
jgi:UDP-glucuronate 4-epimerase